MAEEKETKKIKAPPEKPKKEKKEEAAAAPSVEGKASGEKKSVKINKMNLAEIEAKLQEIQSAQGGWSSAYARHLLRRKDWLTLKK